jgi:hypothetical protein
MHASFHERKHSNLRQSWPGLVLLTAKGFNGLKRGYSNERQVVKLRYIPDSSIKDKSSFVCLLNVAMQQLSGTGDMNCCF